MLPVTRSGMRGNAVRSSSAICGLTVSGFPSSSPAAAAATTASSSRRSRTLVAKASPSQGDKDASGNPFLGSSSPQPTPSSNSKQVDKEYRLESIEAAMRPGRPNKPQRQIPIKGQENKQEANSNYAPWKEGSLLPEGFESMSQDKKVTEILYGQRGFLFWLNRLAYGSAIGLLFAWVLFRLVLPNLGLYKLAGDLTPAPF